MVDVHKENAVFMCKMHKKNGLKTVKTPIVKDGAICYNVSVNKYIF
jgi:hypothetical protein